MRYIFLILSLIGGLRTHIKIDEEAEVTLTFIDEGAGFRNAVGFYVYPQGATINSVSDLGALTIIFPNASKAGAGGGLQTGDTVYLGTIPAGMMVGWFLVGNGYVSGSQVNPNRPHYFSDSQINPEVLPANQQHLIQA